MPEKLPTENLFVDALEDTPVFEGNIELISHYKEKKKLIEGEQYKFLKENPQIQQIASDYLKTVLHRKPDDVYQFTIDYFSMFASAEQLKAYQLQRELKRTAPSPTKLEESDEKKSRVEEKVDVTKQVETSEEMQSVSDIKPVSEVSAEIMEPNVEPNPAAENDTSTSVVEQTSPDVEQKEEAKIAPVSVEESNIASTEPHTIDNGQINADPVEGTTATVESTNENSEV